MRPSRTQTRELIAGGGFDFEWVADLMYDGKRVLANVPIGKPDLNWNAGAFVVGSGNVPVVWSDDYGRSMIPQQIGDPFSPFGAELQIDCIVGAGAYRERIPQGRFLIESVPRAEQKPIPFLGRMIHPGEEFVLQVKDPLLRVQRDSFAVPTPSRSMSAWDEVQWITGLPVIRNLPDVEVPRTAYVDGRDNVLSKLFDRLGGWPQVDPSGALTARPKAWPVPVDTFHGIVSAPRALDAAQTYNRVVVEGKAPSGAPIFGVEEVTDGPLRVRNADGTVSPFGGATYRYSSEFLTTEAQCQAYARELLPRVSRIRGVTRDITEPFNPLREVGDVISLPGEGVVRIVQLTHPDSYTHSIVEVPDA